MYQPLHVIIGLGTTGLSCARYLTAQHIPYAVADTRLTPPGLAQFKKEFPDVPLELGPLKEDFLAKAAKLIVSPGISLQQSGIPIIGDIELFAQATKVPTIAITGTNAKSTVTTLVGQMAHRAGLNVGVGGNLGTPALDLLSPHMQLYVLELSSFQLETTYSLAPRVATILNITPDHMDRYATFEEYCAAKQRIYHHCETAVCNRDDPLTDYRDAKKKLSFTLQIPQENEFGLLEKNGEFYIAFEDQLLMPVNTLPVLGRHYQANALASLAIGYAVGLSIESMLSVLSEFKGLPHRCQLVRERNGVRWYNDSKGTNVGATLAAISGLGPVIQGKLILIAGGVGKKQDFSPLLPPIERYVKPVVLIGEDAPLIANILGNRVNVRQAKTLTEAITISDQLANAGDSVLLSPACASFDMFKNFEHRGQVFTETVQNL